MAPLCLLKHCRYVSVSDSGVDNDELIFDGNREGRNRGILLVWLNSYVVGFHPHLMRIEDGNARRDIEFPAAMGI